MGKVDINTLAKVVKQETDEERELEKRRAAKPPLDQCLNLCALLTLSLT